MFVRIFLRLPGLLPLLKSIQKPCNLKKFAGSTIGVDAYGWLHRGTVACAMDLALGKPTTKYAPPAEQLKMPLIDTQIRRLLGEPCANDDTFRHCSIYRV